MFNMRSNLIPPMLTQLRNAGGQFGTTENDERMDEDDDSNESVINMKGGGWDSDESSSGEQRPKSPYENRRKNDEYQDYEVIGNAYASAPRTGH